VRATIDAVRAGLRVEEIELPLSHRATRSDARGFAHRGRQLADALLGLLCASNRLGKPFLAGGGRRGRRAFECALTLFETRALLLHHLGDTAQCNFAVRQLGDPLLTLGVLLEEVDQRR